MNRLSPGEQPHTGRLNQLAKRAIAGAIFKNVFGDGGGVEAAKPSVAGAMATPQTPPPTKADFANPYDRPIDYNLDYNDWAHLFDSNYYA